MFVNKGSFGSIQMKKEKCSINGTKDNQNRRDETI